MTTVTFVLLSFFTALCTAALVLCAILWSRVDALQRDVDAQHPVDLGNRVNALAAEHMAAKIALSGLAEQMEAVRGSLKRLTGVVHGRRRVEVADEDADRPKSRDDLRAELLGAQHSGLQ